MRSPSPGRSARSWVGALAVLLAWVVLGPAPAARAGCLHRAQPRLDARAAASASSLAPFGLAPPPADAPRPAESRRPCTGAMCSGQPSPPVSSTAPAPVRLGSWALLPPSPPPAAPQSSLLPRDERDARPLAPAGSVFHPPRLVLPLRTS